jgi:pantoate--beta-alanine ligase
MKKKLQIIKSIRVMQKRSERYRRLGKKIGLVPTMGALHEGHISLIKKSVRQNDFTVVSIFVNPTQFGPDEDFSKYPRAFKSDCRKALEVGADIIFNPPADEIYPDNFQTYIDPGPIARRLEGAARPGHMRGVATVCIKLFNICLPHHAYFGQKDAQQLAMIRSVVRDLNFDLKIVRCPIVRTKTGVALSSRHSYLSGDDLRKAEVIYDSLPGVKVEYIAFNRWDDLEEVIEIRGKVLISLVVVIGGVRLLDNIIVNA